MPAKRKYYPPTSYKAVTIYLTPEQHKKVKKLAEEDAERLTKLDSGRPHRVSMADFIRSVIDKL